MLTMKKLLDKFVEVYNYLYEHHNMPVPGISDAVKEFDDMLATPVGKLFIRSFAEYRGDAVTSDREAAAFIFALRSCENP